MKKVLVAVVVVLVALVAFIASRPSQYHVERSATIEAPPDSVYARIVDFHHWNDWSPWAKLDPACKNSYSGAVAGKDAGFAWDGNKKVGAGRMTITDSQAAELIRINLEFLRPFEATSTTEFTFKQQGSRTEVTWTMFVKNNLMSKVFGLFADCDTMVGKDFEISNREELSGSHIN
jgi:opacity protein-like surface antigen